MAREVRISVDDDEVFERMKRRKQELDLSWEEVLHRGLRPPETPPEPDPEPGWNEGSWPTGPDHPSGPRHQTEGSQQDEPLGDVVDEFRRQVKDQVTNSLRMSMQGMQEANEELEREMGELAEAEDATLTFTGLDDPEHTVPLRVNQRTSRAGLEVDVVAVRQGKNVQGTNQFDRSARQQLNTSLARGEPATLRFENGTDAEAYRVYPVLSWGKDDAGRPTVTEVEIDEVVLEDE
jgi:hypothetical protein